MIRKIVVVGGGSAGFLAALALKVKMPDLRVVVIRSKDIGIIGVGEGSTIALTRFLHEYLGVGQKKFHDTAQPTWKLGLKFLRWARGRTSSTRSAGCNSTRGCRASPSRSASTATTMRRWSTTSTAL